MHIALKGCSPPHTNEPVQFWIGFGLVLIGGSGLNPLGLLTPHWIIQQVIDRNASRRHMGPIYIVLISGQEPKEGGLKAKLISVSYA